MKKKSIAWIVVLFLIFLVMIFLFDNYSKQQQTNQLSGKTEYQNFEIIAQELKIPWEIAFLPNGEILVTQREGRLVKIGKNKEKIIISIPNVRHAGEGGLLGMVLHPYFEQNHFIYLYLTASSGSGTINRVERYLLDGNELKDKKVIIDNIPGASFHDGGRIAFGPDTLLYITTGDAGNSNLAQDKDSLAGKILRLKDDGAIPEDNPFNNAVYSYGHRNSQGLAWDGNGNLWATEHGRSGALSGLDEINLIEKGANYGWPEIEGDEKKDGMKAPIINSGPDITWAPSGMAYLDGKLYFAGLRGEALYEATISGKSIKEIKVHNGTKCLFS